jgi:hypothetical protein
VCRQRSRFCFSLRRLCLVLVLGISYGVGLIPAQDSTIPDPIPSQTTYVRIPIVQWNQLMDLSQLLEMRLMERNQQVLTLRAQLNDSRTEAEASQSEAQQARSLAEQLRTVLMETSKSLDESRRSLSRERLSWSIEREELDAQIATARNERDEEYQRANRAELTARRNLIIAGVSIPVSVIVWEFVKMVVVGVMQ